MATCKQIVDKAVMTCKNGTSEMSSTCGKWADEGQNGDCAKLVDEGKEECGQLVDEGKEECGQLVDEGKEECAAWGKKCRWYKPWNCVMKLFCKGYYWVANLICKAYYWVANLVCKAYYWVANLVCKAYYWVAKWVCKFFLFVIKVFCVVGGWIANPACALWQHTKCEARNIFSIIFGKSKRSSKVEHVFVLMLENRSFDHMLGSSGIKGIDINGAPATINGVDPALHFNIDPNDPAKTKVPVSSPADFKLAKEDKDPGHEFEDVLMQLGGKNDKYPDLTTGGYPNIDNSGFLKNYIGHGSAHPNTIMNGFTPQQLPILNTLAREFAVCDNWFSSMPGPTWPNRFFMLAGTSGGLDHSPGKWDIISSIGFEGYRFENGNIFDLLDENCLDWQIFEGDEFPVSFALSGMNVNALRDKFKNFAYFKEEVNDPGFDKSFVFIEPDYGQILTGDKDYSCGNSMHPMDDVTRGEKLIKAVYETIRNSPHWEKSVLLVVFDEHGGFYDHVKPPSAVPPGDLVSAGNSEHGFKFDQLGVRVPALVISPLIKKGVIDNTLYDHTSLLASVEHNFGLSSLTERDKRAKNFLHLLQLDEPRKDTPETLPEVPSSGFSACEDDRNSAQRMSSLQIELSEAKERGVFRDGQITLSKPSRLQQGFAYIALLKILQEAKYPERKRWIEEFEKLDTNIDVGKFIVEAKLKLRHGIDIRREELELEKEKERNYKETISS